MSAAVVPIPTRPEDLGCLTLSDSIDRALRRARLFRVAVDIGLALATAELVGMGRAERRRLEIKRRRVVRRFARLGGTR